jgi:hypothetical protein
LKRATIPGLAIAIALLFPARERRAEAASFEGTVSASLTRSETDTTQFLFTRKGDQLRIEHTDKSKPEPVNIVDLAAKKLTIIYPHNSTFVQVDLTKAETQTGGPNLPPGFPPPPKMNTSPGEAAITPVRIGPAISPPPGFPTPPPRPSMPPMPNNPLAGAPNMPMMPPMPPMGGFGATPELKKTDKAKKIQGFDCTLYTISDRMETFEIWATPDSTLFPFRLLERNYDNRHFGPVMLEEKWSELLQKKSLFPLEATLRTDRGDLERLTFKVDKIEKKQVENGLFAVPEHYYEIKPGP